MGTETAEALALPVRVANDADIQGMALIEGRGAEIVITLGTGFGTACFSDGAILPKIELAHHPFRKDQTYEEQLGEVARQGIGNERWNRRVAKALPVLDQLFAFDRLYVGGGNAKYVGTKVIAPYEGRVMLADNRCGLLGGVKPWS